MDALRRLGFVEHDREGMWMLRMASETDRIQSQTIRIFVFSSH